MAIVLFDNPSRSKLQPLTYTRAVADLRMGILTARERWEKLTGMEVFVQTLAYLQPLYQPIPQGVHLWIDAAVVMDETLTDLILTLKDNAAIKDNNGLIAVKAMQAGEQVQGQVMFLEKEVKRLRYPWQIMQWNDEQLRRDFALLTAGRISQPIAADINLVGAEQVFIEEGATLSFSTINASTGPVYIGRNATIMEGCAIRGPFSIGEGSVLKMNSRIYGATTLGPYCMGGGEIKNTVMMGYSNKAHDGYLGDSVVGEWCNFGAGSSNSNIKNTAGEIKVWSMGEKTYVPVGQKCGVIMGDYSRAAINSSINTGSVIGVSSNVFGAGLLPTIIANFRWGASGMEYEFEKALRDINNWKSLKGQSLDPAETSVLKYIFELR